MSFDTCPASLPSMPSVNDLRCYGSYIFDAATNMYNNTNLADIRNAATKLYDKVDLAAIQDHAAKLFQAHPALRMGTAVVGTLVVMGLFNRLTRPAMVKCPECKKVSQLKARSTIEIKYPKAEFQIKITRHPQPIFYHTAFGIDPIFQMHFGRGPMMADPFMMHPIFWI